MRRISSRGSPLGERSTISIILALAWPAIVEQALQTIVHYIDTAMVGSLGVHATASVGMTASVTWLSNAPLWSMGIGVLACVARSFGAKDEKGLHTLAQQAIFLALVLGALNTMVTEVIAPFLPRWLRAEPGLHRDGYLYYAIICSPYVFRSMAFILASVLRGVGDTRSPMRINLGMNLINVSLNYLFIYPKHEVSLLGFSFSMPGFGWGVTGAAAATAISIVFSGIAMFICVLKNPVLSPRSIPWRVDRKVMGKCVRIGLPVMLQNLCVFSGHVIFSSLVTSMGETILATHTIAITSEQAFYIPGFGMQASASTLCGNCVGERNEAKLDKISRTILLMSMGMMTVTGAVLFAIPDTMMSLFTRDPDVIRGGISVLRMVACSEPFYAAMIIFEGIFHGVGQTRYPFFVSLFTMWVLRVGGSALCISLFGANLQAVWACMICDNVGRAFLLAIRYFRGNWKRSLRLDQA